MGIPSVGDADTPVIEKTRKRKVKELTVLDEGSKDSIYNLLFSETEKKGLKGNGE